MSKPKKSRTADKYIESLISELKAQGEDGQFDGDAFSEAEKGDQDSLEYTGSSDVKASQDVTLDPDEDGDAAESTTGRLPEGLELGDIDKDDSRNLKEVKAKAKKQFRDDESVTMPLQRDNSRPETSTLETNVSERTQPMASGHAVSANEPSVKMSFGVGRSAGRAPASAAGQQSEIQLIQAENLKLAQARILELENEMEKLRQENELLASAGAIAKQRLDEMTEKLHANERYRNDALEQSDLEMKILRESLFEKERDFSKMKKKLDEMDGRLHTDMKKIRVRERELENRLELARMEKTALVRSKDENILDLKRKLDDVLSELENHKHKSGELQDKIDQQQDQLGRTVRALRLALTNLESSDSTSGQLVPMKKAD